MVCALQQIRLGASAARGSYYPSVRFRAGAVYYLLVPLLALLEAALTDAEG